jgi:hypothetical protein
MNSRVCVGILAFGLAGMLAEGSAQETVWRPVVRPPAPVVTPRGVASDRNNHASLGRPVAVAQAVSILSADPPRPFPPAYAANYSRGVEPIATVPPPGAVIAASVPAAVPWTGSAEESQDPPAAGDSFASDRLAYGGPAARTGLLPAAPPEPQQLRNWQGTIPVTAPLPDAQAPAVQAFGADLPPTKWYARADYLLWWTKNDRAPVLVTTGPERVRNDPFNPANNTVGQLDQPDTTILDDGHLRRGAFSGGRFTFGYYLDDCGEKAIEVSGFFLAPSSSSFTADSFGFPVLTRPFLAVNPGGGEDAQRVSFPGQVCGRVSVRSPSQLWGAEANLLCQWCCGCNWRVDPLVGARFLALHESLNITEDLIIATNLPDGQSFLSGARATVFDQFSARNQFYGGQVGIEGRWQRDRWTVDGRFKLALGVSEETLTVKGFQDVLFGNGVRQTFVGGLLALNSNIGQFDRDRFAVVPEFSVSVGYYLTERLRALLGYNFLYWSSVVRPGDQIDRGLDVNRIPNFLPPGVMAPAAADLRPARLFIPSDFWAQGLTFGLEYRY